MVEVANLAQFFWIPFHHTQSSDGISLSSIVLDVAIIVHSCLPFRGSCMMFTSGLVSIQARMNMELLPTRLLSWTLLYVEVIVALA